MTEKLKKMLENKRSQAAELESAIVDAETKEERAEIGETLKALRDEIDEVEAMIAESEKPAEEKPAEPEEEGERMKVMETMDVREANTEMEKRNAFKKFVETRGAAGNTTTGENVGTAIPQNLIDQIIEKLETVGTIYNLVSKTAYPVGQTIPKEATKPVATWVGATTSPKGTGEGEGSTVSKEVLDTQITFSHFKLRCEVAMTEEVAQMSLPSFEALFVKNVSLAMLRAIEFGIVDGDGQGMPTGILSTTVAADHNLDVTDEIAYETICDAEGLIPVEYEANAKWCMSKKTFMSFIGMTDGNGQPVARINYGLDGKPERMLLGREVVIYSPQANSHLDVYKKVTDRTADTIFAFIFNFDDYTLNSNYDLGIQTKQDWNNEDHRIKAVAAYDGKVVVKESLITLTQKKTA